jgi:hypothetical protein
MTKNRTGLLSLALALTVVLGLAVAPTQAGEQITRTSVKLPADAKAVLLAQMLGHIVGLDAIANALAQGQFTLAAAAARESMGVPRGAGDNLSGAQKAGKPGPGLGIGKYLPDEMKVISARFHDAANAFADLADSVSATPSAQEHMQIYKALANITTQCRDCHDRFTVH